MRHRLGLLVTLALSACLVTPALAGPTSQTRGDPRCSAGDVGRPDSEILVALEAGNADRERESRELLRRLDRLADALERLEAALAPVSVGDGWRWLLRWLCAGGRR